MSLQRQGEVIHVVLQSAHRDCPLLEMVHVVFYSYKELSTKEGERIRRAKENIPIELTVVDESVPIPHQLDKFWSSSLNNQNPQLLAREVAE